ncbi:Ca2+-dependent phosphoinositide-specific phospholipase C [Caulobacter sp. S45]|uniref:Ca2+-dependent phosphoinositide-specific phospholipase C n=1 Tax=Caulobacter sp. S45 TaxID=1641861 RepID=UPI0020B13415|nr:Ca2+-dependent phosphoinositide-specific phospholipase C [Caulobacter sp. S45]
MNTVWKRAFATVAMALALPLLAGTAARAADDTALDALKLNQVRMLGSHNSYRRLPSPGEEQRIKAVALKYWPGLDYGHPPLESQLALGLHQFEIDVAPDAKGGAYASPYADATPEVKALMAAPGAKVLHVAGLDTEVHCLTFRKCLAIFARWSDAHPGHEPVVILVNSVDPLHIPVLFPYDLKFDQAGIDEINQDIIDVIGRNRVVTPDEVRGEHATLREAVTAKSWPKLGSMRGKFLFVLDGNDAHEVFLRTGHPSLKGRMMFGWFDEDRPEAAFFNIQDPIKNQDRIRSLVGQGFIVRSRSDEDTKEARTRDGGKMKSALSSGAQIVSSDYYAGVPDPEGFGFTVDFEGPMIRCNEVTATCPPTQR